MGYSVTNRDRLAMTEILNATWHVNFTGARERGEETHTQWLVHAPNPQQGLDYKVYHTTSGFSIAEAVNNWFSEMDEINDVPIEREVWSGIWDAKMELGKEEE